MKNVYGLLQDMEEVIKSKLGGILKGHDFQHLVLALLDEPAMFDARCLREAMKGLRTDETTLIEILCTRTNQVGVVVRVLTVLINDTSMCRKFVT